MKKIEFEATDAHHGRRLFDVLLGLRFSSALIKKLKRTGGILKDGQIVFTTHLVSAGEKFTFLIEDEPVSEIALTEGRLLVLYEDDDILAIDKPANLNIHPTRGDHLNTLGNFVMHYYKTKGITSIYHPITRLDRDTTGVVLIAKNPYSAAFLNHEIKEGNMAKKYIAIVEGAPGSGTIDAPIEREEGSIITRCVSMCGKPSVTSFNTLETKKGFSLVEVIPLTGRTHQIRVHFKHIGCPIVSDFLYGTERDDYKGHALHMKSLTFMHPSTLQSLTVTAPVPKEMDDFFQSL